MSHHNWTARLVWFVFLNFKTANIKPNIRYGIKKEGVCYCCVQVIPFVRCALDSPQCFWDSVFDLSARGPNLLKLDCECLVSAAGPVCRSRGSTADRRPRKTSRCYGAALDEEEENHNYNAAITMVSKSPGWSAVCFHSASAALTASHTTSSLGQPSLPDLGWRN